jgi:phage baseplate assembly protein W
MAKRKFIGLQYPLTKTPRGTLAQKSGIDQIKADLLQLLLTNPGERVMLPLYGTPLRKLFFEPNDVIVKAQAKAMIAKSIAMWEPRIVIDAIEVVFKFNPLELNKDDTQDDVESILGIKIKIIDPDNISEVNELVLELPVGRGT